MSEFMNSHQWLAVFLAMLAGTIGIVAIDYFWRHRND